VELISKEVRERTSGEFSELKAMQNNVKLMESDWKSLTTCATLKGTCATPEKHNFCKHSEAS